MFKTPKVLSKTLMANPSIVLSKINIEKKQKLKGFVN